ncbi:RNA polymerase sigma-70 factor, ECF subfamily [Dyadobacter sp. SG02]|uniref:RNA polymerase sigma factor n=1 Tax=Dyadobacter sp. SG02 TaxID=1855291 RepID=UPI0008C3BF89|nr:sigma-70 family RNA polymerase sigma factor [Dyadobacter sp. SG02]SEI49428.1 RNA polymerase sigma-70 factor, ECF subfamily [Dyadobacter sp. SG02]
MGLFKSKHVWDPAELIKACLRKEPRAQEVFYERYKKKLIGVCLRYARTAAEAEDIFQEGILKIFGRLHEVREPLALDGWVKTTMIRHSINYYNLVTKKENLNVTIESSDVVWESNDYTDFLTRFEIVSILEVINELPDGYRMMVNMYFIDGYSHAEIAEMLGIAESTSRSQAARGRNLLLKKLEEKGIRHYESY